MDDHEEQQQQHRYLTGIKKGHYNHIHINGDFFHRSRKILVHPKFFRDLSHYLDFLSETLRPNFGPVRRLVTPNCGRRRVRSLEDLRAGDVYVAAGVERFKPFCYVDIDTSPRRRDPPRNHDFDSWTNKRYNQISGKCKTVEIHNTVIKVHPNGNHLSCPRNVVLPAQKVNTLEDVLFWVDRDMCLICNGPIVKLYDVDGNKIISMDQISPRCAYVACRKGETYQRARYPDQGAQNFSNSRQRDFKLPTLTPRSNKSSSHSSPEHSNASHNGYRRERNRRNVDSVFNGKPIQHKRSSQRRDVDYDQDNGPFKNKNQNPYTRDARPIEDSHHTRTERPIDDRPAEEVQDEDEFHAFHDNEDDPGAGGDYQEEATVLPPVQDRTHRSNARTSNSPGNEQAHKEAAARRQAEDRARAEKNRQDREAAEQRRREKEEQRRREQEEKRREQEERRREQEERKREREEERKREQEDKKREREEERRREQEERKREREEERKREQEERKREREEERKREQEERKKARQDEQKQDKAAKGNKQKDSKASKDKSPAPASEEEEAAATKIQASYRGYKTRKDMKQARREEEEAYGGHDSSLLRDDPIPLDGDDDWGSDINHHNVREEEAATKIQAAFRGHQTRKEVDKLRNQEVKDEDEERNSLSQSSPKPVDTQQSDPEAEHVAATKIQATYRGHQTRKQLAAETEAENAAASKIQASFRGHQTRKQLAAEAEAENAAASKIQATYRGHQTRKQLAAEAEAENAAASKIQASFRGHQTRKQLAAEAEAENAAASKIQATYRGHQTRKQLAASKAAGEEDPAMEDTEHNSNNIQSN